MSFIIKFRTIDISIIFLLSFFSFTANSYQKLEDIPRMTYPHRLSYESSLIVYPYYNRQDAHTACNLQKKRDIDNGSRIRPAPDGIIYNCKVILNGDPTYSEEHVIGHFALSRSSRTSWFAFLGVNCPSNTSFIRSRGCVPKAQLEAEEAARKAEEAKRKAEEERRIAKEKRRKEIEDLENAKEDLGNNKSCTAGNPIKISTGNKFQLENIFNSSSNPFFNFSLSYNSATKSWRKSYSQSVTPVPNDPKLMILNYSDGRKLVMEDSEGTWLHRSGDRGFKLKQTPASGDWEYTRRNNVTEHYNQFGKLISISKLGIQYVRLEYTSANTVVVTDNINHKALTMEYGNAGQIIKVIIPSGGTYRFSYKNNGMLQYLSVPDNTSQTGTNPFFEDNPYRQYHYEDSLNDNLLTGITDEKGIRFATWKYDGQGRAISSQHAENTEKVSLEYSIEYDDDEMTKWKTITTNTLGKRTAYIFTNIHGAPKLSEVQGYQSENCLAANRSISYNDQGLVTHTTDWNSNTVAYEYNDRGLVVRKTVVDDSYSDLTHRTYTEWHDEFNLPISITEPNRKTLFTYDEKGQLITKRIIAN